ncbi:NAC domain-containing protein [Actinidia chinensis var. chinensis]|uniref:NAC domain-containing protein n=1 Tax=Actinidia chinensis var. chinensis TaxID=1590841 RepID=A0A2R6P751_ACTCC|nr:NAC domain-containing protein [Actinidia chinensis var. chinensis]
MDEMPPGYRFYPTEEELISFYLRNKLQGRREEMDRVIPVLEVFELEPWHLPKLSGKLCRRDTEQWFFFAPRQEREAHGGRPSRTMASGYWKATGSPGYVYSSDNRVIGVQKTMVFYKGKAPAGRKTKWKMHEYRAIEQQAGCAVPKLRHELSLCRVYVKSGSFRAFDRRPTEAETRDAVPEQQRYGDKFNSQATQTVEKTSSPESSYSGEDHFEPPQANMGMFTALEPIWEWEQLNLG